MTFYGRTRGLQGLVEAQEARRKAAERAQDAHARHLRNVRRWRAVIAWALLAAAAGAGWKAGGWLWRHNPRLDLHGRAL